MTPRRFRSALAFNFCAYLFFLVLTSCGPNLPERTFRGAEIQPLTPAPEIELKDQFNRPFSLKNVEGKIVLIFFGFTNCPDVCPHTMRIWSEIAAGLNDDEQQVKFVYITVDPVRDRPEGLAEYLKVFNPGFIGLWGSEVKLKRVFQSYGVYVEKPTATSGPNPASDITHTPSTFLVDNQGRWRLNYSFGVAAADVIHDIRLLLAE